MSDATKAVFLSYAREDAAAARQIAETLRAGGIEVWFDQSELRGGDAWDADIRKQIRECVLFVPVISAHTNARAEGFASGNGHGCRRARRRFEEILKSAKPL